ncbi:MAG: DUF5050 domain-containing protein [Oscillospiraceae bacterium]
MKKLLGFEFEKMLLKRKGILIIFIFILLKIIFLAVSNDNINLFVEDNKELFFEYDSRFSGLVTEEKSALIETEYRRINDAKLRTDTLYSDLENGIISYDEFVKEVAIADEYASKQWAFNAIYNKYQYANENPSQRYFLYDNGWNALLSSERLDVIFILLILVLISPIFCYEYESEMDKILLTSQNGRGKIAVTKIFASCIIVAILATLFCVVEYSHFNFEYGLPHGDFPLQSLEYFKTSLSECSLLETFLTISALKIFGSVMLALIIMCISTLFKKIIITLFSSCAIVFLPYILPINAWVKYLIPSPVGFLIGQGFFRGDEVKLIEDVAVPMFKRIDTITFAGVLTLSLFLCFIMACLTIFSYLNKHVRFYFKKSALVFTLVLTLCLTGCSATITQEISYNSRLNGFYAAVDTKMFFCENGTVKMYDTQTKAIDDVFHNAFEEENNQQVRSVYVFENSLYCLISSELKLNIIEVDLKTFEQKSILTFSAEEKSYFLGIVQDAPNDLELVTTLRHCKLFLNEKYIFLASDHELYRISKATATMKKIASDLNGIFCFDGNQIYYSNTKYQVVILDCNTLQTSVLENIRSDYFVIKNNKLYFSNLNDKNTVYEYDFTAKRSKKLLDNAMRDFVVDEDFLYFKNLNDWQKLWRFEFDNNSSEQLADLSPGFFITFYNFESVIVPETDSLGNSIFHNIDKTTSVGG